MMGVVGNVRRSIESIKDWVIKDLIKQQKPELDRKIDEMLKPPKVNQIMIKYLGIGMNFGKTMKRLGRGLRLGKGVKLLRKLF